MKYQYEGMRKVRKVRRRGAEEVTRNGREGEIWKERRTVQAEIRPYLGEHSLAASLFKE